MVLLPLLPPTHMHAHTCTHTIFCTPEAINKFLYILKCLVTAVCFWRPVNIQARACNPGTIATLSKNQVK